MAKLKLATCQFPVVKNVKENLVYALRQIKQARGKGADLVHFPECCLSGYFGVELKSPRDANWDAVAEAMNQVMAAAKQQRMWVVIGCNHRLSGKHKPHNSLYVINPQGKIVTRYDKMFCTGANSRDGDLRYYSPGDSFVTFKVGGVTCGLLICHDFRYPELFREYKKKGVQLMLVSFHNARMKLKQYDHYIVSVPVTLQAAAASNYFYVSGNNGTMRRAWASFVADPEGKIISKARTHSPAVVVTKIDTKKKLYDASVACRDRCMSGIYHSGTRVADPRSRNRKCL